MSGPLPVSAASGGVVFLIAESSAVTGDVTPLAILAGVLATVVGLLGWVVRHQQSAAERQSKADREEREKDREHDRAERAEALATFRAELAAERQLAREMNGEVVRELQRISEDARSGRHCRAGDDGVVR